MIRKRRVTLFLALCLVVTGALLRPQAARADDTTEAKEHFKKGTKAFELGAYDEAVSEYAAAYRLRDDPALLYNLAQAHKLAGHPVEAIRFYRLFLMKVPGASNRDEVREKITELQKLVDQQKKAQNIPPDSVKPPTPVQPAQPSAAPSPPPPPREVVATSHEGAADLAAEHSARTKKIAGIVVAAVGVGLVAGGIATGVLSQQASDKLTNLDQTKQPFDYNLEQTGKTDQILEGVLIGVGAAAIVTGGIVYFLGHREKKLLQRVSLVPSIGRGAAGAALEGHF